MVVIDFGNNGCRLTVCSSKAAVVRQNLHEMSSIGQTLIHHSVADCSCRVQAAFSFDPLDFGKPDNQTVHIVMDNDLAREARIAPRLKKEFQQRRLGCVSLTHLAVPLRIDIDASSTVQS